MSGRRKAIDYKELRDIVKKDWTPPHNPFDEVFPGIYIGDAITALSLGTLKWEGITHVVNGALACASCLRKELCGACVLTRDSYYLRDGIAFCGVQANDERRFPLYRYFAETTRFIDDALLNGGKVLVHCREGISRSATLVIAYLMLKKDMSAMDAVRLVRSKRQIYPNDGFLEQLCDLDLRLRTERTHRER